MALKSSKTNPFGREFEKHKTTTRESKKEHANGDDIDDGDDDKDDGDDDDEGDAVKQSLMGKGCIDLSEGTEGVKVRGGRPLEGL